MTRQALGREAERRAEAFLRDKGMEILARNYRIREAEIDLIARDGTYVVFVEVKARSDIAYGWPREAVDARKTMFGKERMLKV
nr:YraN family protein [Clostridia bacterium]